MGKLFGTDGIRGVVNRNLNAELAFRVGCAAAQVLRKNTKRAKPLFTIGKDTRISSDLLEGALIAGLCSAGADVLHLGVIPTPGVAWVTVDSQADAGIVISASHNPFEHNGIKIFNGDGFKLSDSLENEIETLILSEEMPSLKVGAEIGQVTYADQQESDAYIEHLASTAEKDFSGMRILVDCANGAASATAWKLFDRFPKLHADIINADPDGININHNCGSTHIENLAKMVTAGSYDLGIAFDGDADRCLAVDEEGNLIDGDKIMAICALVLREEGKLAHDTIVGTVMSNLGLHLFVKENHMTLLCTDVGDRNVLERMLEGGFSIGGEQSGHTIFLEHSTTGDGQLTAIQLMGAVYGKKASQMASICASYPQVLLNVPVADKAQKEAVMASEALQAAITEEEEAMQGSGRILVRPSGTESLVRVMVEAKSETDAKETARKLSDFIKNLL